MKLFKLMGIMLLSTGLILFAGCGTDDDDPADTAGDTGVEAADADVDTDTDLDADTDDDGLDATTEDLDTDTTEEDDTSTETDAGEEDDRTELEIFCDSVCEFAVACADAEGPAKEDELENCLAECESIVGEEAEENADCIESLMNAYTCFIELECEEALSLFGGETPITDEEHACYDVWNTWNNTCNPLPTREEINASCEAACTNDETCHADEIDPEDYDETLEECMTVCEMEYGTLALLSRDCADAMFDYNACLSTYDCAETEDSESGICEDQLRELGAACSSKLIFASQCEDLYNKYAECDESLDVEELYFCGEVLHDIYAVGTDECADGYIDFFNCMVPLECEEFTRFLDEDPPTPGDNCYPEFAAIEHLCAELD